MEITNDLLVVIMYVVLITIGIGNIVMTLAAIIIARPESNFSGCIMAG